MLREKIEGACLDRTPAAPPLKAMRPLAFQGRLAVMLTSPRTMDAQAALSEHSTRPPSREATALILAWNSPLSVASLATLSICRAAKSWVAFVMVFVSVPSVVTIINTTTKR